MRYVLRRVFLFSFCALLSAGASSCLGTLPTPAASSSPTPTTTSTTTTTSNVPTVIVPSVPTSSEFGFTGASSAIDLSGTQIKVSWSPSTSHITVSYQVLEQTPSTGALSLVAMVPVGISSYVIAGLANGSFHTYIVRAFDTNLNTDGNSAVVSAITYGGVTSVSNLGNVEAALSFPAGSPSTVSQLHIYCTPSGGTKTLMATVPSTQTSYSLTGLTANTAYSCNVQEVSPYGGEDQNTATVAFTTRGYQGVIAVKAYGDAPTAPVAPTARQVSLTWNQFIGATGTTAYKLVRVGKGQTVDMTTSATCSSITASTATSCLVCTAFGLGAKTCSDTLLDTEANFAQYDYLVSSAPYGTLLSSTAWTLPVADAGYRVTVPVPPPNMVLVNRDAVNFEECTLMAKTSDPLNHQRCPYTGLGAVPYSSGKSTATYTNGAASSPLYLPTNYLDQGYNFFIDRWENGLNWTTQAAGGMCGAAAVAGNCFGTAVPVNSIGVAGNIYFDAATRAGYVFSSGAWSAATAANYTNAPGVGQNIPPIFVNQAFASQVCQNYSDSNYGLKRLPRQREFVAAAAWPTLTGEPGAMTDAQITTMEAGATAGSTCFVVSTVITRCTFNSANCSASIDSGAEGGAYGAYPIIVASSITASCSSRFGAQDLAGNQEEWASDAFDLTNNVLYGVPTTFDVGNLDTETYTGLGLTFDGVQGPVLASGTGLWVLSAKSDGAVSFSVPLGIPLVGTDNGNAMTISSWALSS